MISSYSSIYTIGHKACRELFLDEVVIQEKLDGSQISFGVLDGELKVRSKGVQINIESPDKMFAKAVEYIKSIQGRLNDGYTFRGEYLSKPQHNTLKYNRVPKNHIVLFDVDKGDQDYCQPLVVRSFAEHLELEHMPVYYSGKVESLADILPYMDRESFLGGPKVEGIVVKNYNRFTQEKKVLMGKYVSAEFKEQHKVQWKNTSPQSGDILQRLILTYKHENRWKKAVQTLRDSGKLSEEPKDIGLLIATVKEDIQKECEDEIKEALYAWAKDQILRGATAGLPEWYKDQLFRQSATEGV